MLTVFTVILGYNLKVAKFANKCEIKKLNRIIGSVLLVLGIFTVLMKLFV